MSVSAYESYQTEPFSPNAKQLYVTSDQHLYQNTYRQTYEPQPAYAPKGAYDHASGSETVIVDGATVTISWTVEAGFIGWRYWIITYSDGTSETYWGSFESAKKYASEEAKKKAEEQAHSVPLGDFPLLLLLCLIMTYQLRNIYHYNVEKHLLTYGILKRSIR